MTRKLSKIKLPVEIKNLDELNRLIQNLNKAIEELSKFEVEIAISKP